VNTIAPILLTGRWPNTSLRIHRLAVARDFIQKMTPMGHRLLTRDVGYDLVPLVA
jgi:hypothetical protein